MAEVSDVIQAKAFQLVDESGNVTAEFKSSTIGKPAFGLRDQGGNVRMLASLDENGEPFLILYNKTNQVRYLVALDENGEPSEALYNGRYRTLTMADSHERRPYNQSRIEARAASPQQASPEGGKTNRFWSLLAVFGTLSMAILGVVVLDQFQDPQWEKITLQILAVHSVVLAFLIFLYCRLNEVPFRNWALPGLLLVVAGGLVMLAIHFAVYRAGEGALFVAIPLDVVVIIVISRLGSHWISRM